MTKNEVLKYFSSENEEQAKRYIYKYTDCGAWIEFEEDGIALGSIVEGSESGTTTFKIKYEDITENRLEETIKTIESEASLIWDWANKIGEDGLTDADRGLDFPIL
jgi:hypothetical protein